MTGLSNSRRFSAASGSPTFSVIVPAYNSEEYICEALDSLVGQTYAGKYEVICVDDGSTDSTPGILDDYASAHDVIRVLHRDNQGPLLARREGLQVARGEYAMFLDSDDCYRKDALEVVANAIKETGADIISFTHSRTPDFAPLRRKADMLKTGLYAGERYSLVKRHLSRGRFNTLWNKSIRMSRFDLLESYSQYRGLKHGEDWFQLIPVIDASKSLCQLSDALYYYRPNNSSGTASFRQSQVSDIAVVHSRFLDYARRWGDDCYRLACGGEAIQYINLLKISELSNVTKAEKSCNFALIADTMRRDGTFERCGEADLRPDNRQIVWALKHGCRHVALVVVKAVEAMKR